MDLNYQFYENISKFQVKNSAVLKDSIYYALIVYNLCFLLSGETHFCIYNYQNENNITKLKIKFKNKSKMEIVINENIIKIIYNNIKYVFKHNYIANGVDLNLKEIYFYNNLLLEEFSPHQVTLSKQIEDRIFRLEIPLETNKTINPRILSNLNYHSEIPDLENIYYHYFYAWQQKEPYNEYTNLIIYDVLGTDYKLREEEKLYLGKPYFKQYGKKIGDIEINASMKKDEEPLITIKGLTSKSNIDLNKEVRFLLNKIENFEKPYLRLIK